MNRINYCFPIACCFLTQFKDNKFRNSPHPAIVILIGPATVCMIIIQQSV